MNKMKMNLLGIACIAAASTSAGAWEFRCRFVERTGIGQEPLFGNMIDASDGGVRNIRVQFGVFNDADGPAPDGGFEGWNLGTITVSGPADNSDERRNNGRIAPFNFGGGPNANGNPPLPGGDPFTTLTEIDSILGTQSPVWVCEPDGTLPPPPPAVVRGRNTFISVYAFSIDPAPGATTYEITLGGNLIGVMQWQFIGTPGPPVCPTPDNPEGIPGSVSYAPFPTEARAFSSTLTVIVPSPSGATLSIVAGVAALRRRRKSPLPASQE